MPYLVSRITEQGRRIFGVAIAALGVEHLVCANMAPSRFPRSFTRS